MEFQNARGNIYTLSEISQGGHEGQFHVDRDGLCIFIDGTPYWPTKDALDYVIDVSAQIARLQGSSKLHVIDALDQLHYVAKRNPYDVLAAIPKLELLLDANDDLVVSRGLAVLAAIAEEHPHEIVPLSDELLALTKTEQSLYREDVATSLRAIAEVAPQALTDDISILVDLAASGSESVTQITLETLTLMADSCPEAFSPVISDLGDLLASRPAPAAKQVIICLAILADHNPALAKPYFEELVLGIEPNREADTVIAQAIMRIGNQYPDLVGPYIPNLLLMVEKAVTPVQRELLRVVINQADQNPKRIEPAIDLVVELLESDDPIVTKNAILVLGTLETSAAIEPLKDLQETVSLAEIEWYIHWALQRIQTANK